MKYGEPRYTKDLDVWVRNSAQNSVRLVAALKQFGAPLDHDGITLETFTEKQVVYRSTYVSAYFSGFAALESRLRFVQPCLALLQDRDDLLFAASRAFHCGSPFLVLRQSGNNSNAFLPDSLIVARVIDAGSRWRCEIPV